MTATAPQWLMALLTILGSAGIGGVVVKLVGLRNNAAMELVYTLRRRIERLEGREAKKDVINELKFTQLRHRAQNIAHLFGGLLDMIDLAPEKATEIVARQRAARAQQMVVEERETAELAALLADLARWEAERDSEEERAKGERHEH